MPSRNNRELKELMEKIYALKLDNQNYVRDLIGKVKAIPTFFYDETSNQVTIELKEEDPTYTKSDLSKFYNSIQNIQSQSNQELSIHFTGDQYLYTKVLSKYIDILHFTNRPNVKYYTQKYFKEKILVELQAMEDIFEFAMKNHYSITINQKPVTIIGENFPLAFSLELKDDHYYLTLNQPIHEFHYMIQTNHNVYIYYQNKIYRCKEEFIKNKYAILETFLNNYKQSIHIYKKNLTNFFSLVYPNIQENTQIDKTLYESLKPYIPQKLIPKLYFDFNAKNYLVADLKFCYDAVEFNPIEQPKVEANRNLLEEAIYLNKLIKSGFLLDEKNKRFIMNVDDSIYQFLEEDLEDYIKISKVYTTENFDKKKAKKSDKTSIGVKVDNHLLEIDFQTLPIDLKEMKDVLQRYKVNKKYYRLKDGSFITLENNKDIEFLSTLVDGLDISYKNIEEKMFLPVNRTLYLDKLLQQNKQIEVTSNEKYEAIVKDTSLQNVEQNISTALKDILRDYQKIGHCWLTILDQYGFGGILADDMGLRKNDSDFISISY